MTDWSSLKFPLFLSFKIIQNSPLWLHISFWPVRLPSLCNSRHELAVFIIELFILLRFSSPRLSFYSWFLHLLTWTGCRFDDPPHRNIHLSVSQFVIVKIPTFLKWNNAKTNQWKSFIIFSYSHLDLLTPCHSSQPYLHPSTHLQFPEPCSIAHYGEIAFVRETALMAFLFFLNSFIPATLWAPPYWGPWEAFYIT